MVRRICEPVLGGDKKIKICRGRASARPASESERSLPSLQKSGLTPRVTKPSTSANQLPVPLFGRATDCRFADRPFRINTYEKTGGGGIPRNLCVSLRPLRLRVILFAVSAFAFVLARRLHFQACLPRQACSPQRALTQIAMLRLETLRIEMRPTLRLALPLVLAEIGWMTMGILDTLVAGEFPAM